MRLPTARSRRRSTGTRARDVRAPLTNSRRATRSGARRLMQSSSSVRRRRRPRASRSSRRSTRSWRAESTQGFLRARVVPRTGPSAYGTEGAVTACVREAEEALSSGVHLPPADARGASVRHANRQVDAARESGAPRAGASARMGSSGGLYTVCHNRRPERRCKRETHSRLPTRKALLQLFMSLKSLYRPGPRQLLAPSRRRHARVGAAVCVVALLPASEAGDVRQVAPGRLCEIRKVRSRCAAEL